MTEQQGVEPGHEQDGLVDWWDLRIAQSNIRPESESLHERLAEEIGDVSEGRAKQLLSKAVGVAMDQGANRVSLQHILTADDRMGQEESGADADDDVQDDHDSDVEAQPAADMIEDTAEEIDTVQDAPDAASEDTTNAKPNPEAMDRDALEGEVRDLRDRLDSLEGQVEKLQQVANRDMGLVKGAVNYLLDQPDDIEDFPDAAREFRDQIDGQDDRIDSLQREVSSIDDAMADGGNGGKQAKVFDIVQQARNLREGDQPVVKLKARDIVAATGCSRRYAYDLMDDLPDEYNWLLSAPEMQQYGQLELDNDERALGVDFEGVHSDGVPVNKFTTGGAV